ncbi:hypothetical protein LEP1GSC133_2471 [Leptospira borgpetersenii serovar Pomona str. 200901868]|uniref:Uncharacterized protein n=1 Tax=Leptospira borgpetersenii serovar Pomona str. 200901868 TaxID=1192866 RepID=M6VWN3_LEPBO|nr:hypothetical protein LEP1GSC133_2471 [Leptospira borgpetersenii serovar Pomona str. 200901868]
MIFFHSNLPKTSLFSFLKELLIPLDLWDSLFLKKNSVSDFPRRN